MWGFIFYTKSKGMMFSPVNINQTAFMADDFYHLSF